MMLLLNACGEAADTSGLSGSYVLTHAEENGVALPSGQTEELALRLRLDPDGGGSVSSTDGEEGSLQWSYNGERLSIRMGTVRFAGTVNGSNLMLQNGNGTLSLLFTAVDENAADVSDATVEADPAQDWYGWWKIENSSGAVPVTWYDCCAELLPLEEKGCFRLKLWDEDGSRSEPLAEVLMEEDGSGLLLSVSGYFLYQSVGEGEWVLPIPDDEILFTDFRHDAEGESFLYSIYLRPWGADWSDLSDVQLPFYYEDWYLVLTEQQSPMPDEIPWEALEADRVSSGD